MPKYMRVGEEDPMLTLCRMVVETKYKDIPADVVDFAKKLILDTIGVTIAGSSQDGIPVMVALAKEIGGKEESFVPFYGGKVPASMAAFAIGSMARAIDMGDVHEVAGHSAEYSLPALLAATGLRAVITGKELITAFIIGQEVMIRIGEAVRQIECCTKDVDSGHYIFGVVAAVGKLLKLRMEELKNAMGMAAAMTQPHDMVMYANACHMPRIHHGFLCQDAINICLLAKKGITGPHAIMQGTRGFLNRFDRVESDPALLTAGLGEEWHMTTTMMKPYASCKCTHTAIDGIVSLMDEHDFYPGDIAGVHVEESSINMALVVEPREVKWNPHTTPECQFSLPYTMATAAFDKRVFLDSYTEEAKARKEVRDLMKRITAEEDKDWPPFAARVTVKLKNGRKLTKEVIYVRGHETRPFTMEELITKFNCMIPYSACRLKDSAVDSLIEGLITLENIDDVVKSIIVPLMPQID